MAAHSTSRGVSLGELLRRTARETWDDGVFGQAAQLAFYHFLAIFPVLLLLLIPIARLARTGAEMRYLLTGSFRQFLPEEVAALVAGTVKDLDANAHAAGIVLVIAVIGALWAGINASWAMIAGLNLAYETEEDRGWREVALTATALAVAVVVLVFTALLVTHYIHAGVGPAASFGVIHRIAQWAAIVTILLISFSMFYRYGPNLSNRNWHSSIPGAALGTALWVALTLLVREYFDRFAPYQQIYGRVAATAVLIIWLYVTSATVLIGAELNSEIEKVREQDGDGQAARRKGPRGRRN